MADRYDTLVAKWPEFGAPSASADDIAAMCVAYAAEQPIEPTTPHWYNPSNPQQHAEAKAHHDYQRALHAWHQSWNSFFLRPEIKAKLDRLNEPPMVERQQSTGRYIVIGVDPQGRQIMEPGMVAVAVPGEPWWQQNGFRSLITASDLEAIFVKRGVVLC